MRSRRRRDRRDRQKASGVRPSFDRDHRCMREARGGARFLSASAGEKRHGRRDFRAARRADGCLRETPERVDDWVRGRGDARLRTSSGAGSSCEPARMASSALTVLSASDSDAAHRVARRADPTEALETRPSAWRTVAADERRAATRGRAAVATTTGFRASIAGFMVTTSGVPRTRGASGSAGPRVPQRARLTWQHTCTSCFA